MQDRNASVDLGLEIVLEPDVVPKGTLDIRSLDAAPGAVPPARRIGADGRVYALAEAVMAAGAGAPPRSGAFGAEGPEADTGALQVVKPAIPVTPAADPGLGTTGALLSEEPLGKRLRKKSLHSDTAMPPRPASADSSSSGRHAPPPIADADYETAQISGGFGSALASLVKVTAVLAFFTLATVLTFLYMKDWPLSPVPVATNGNGKPTPVVEKPKAEVAPVPTEAKTEPKPEVARTASESSALAAVGAPPPKVKVSVEEGVESDWDIGKIESLRAAAVRLQQAGRLDEAMAKLDELLALKPGDTDALFRKALIIHKKGDLAAAEAAYEAAAAVAAPGDARAFNNLGLVREDRGNFAGAREAYERGLAHAPSDPFVLTNLGRLETESDPKSALARFEKALDRDPRHPWARCQRAALLATTFRRFEEGTRELETLAGDPSSPVRAEALAELGRAAYAQKRAVDAARYFRQALEQRPGFWKVRLPLGVALFRAGDARGAEEELRAYLNFQPKSPDGWKTLGAVLVKLEQLPEAKVAYEKAIELDKNDADTRFNYALCAERFGNYLFAIEEYKRVIAIQPNHWKALANLGRLYRKAERNDSALEYFDRALRVKGDDPELHLHRANVLAALKRQDDARAALADFIRHAPPGDARIEPAKKAIAANGELAPASVEVPAESRRKGG